MTDEGLGEERSKLSRPPIPTNPADLGGDLKIEGS
jgi:hypothetical protein